MREEKIVCNRCGKKIKTTNQILDYAKKNEFQHLEFNFGYGSKFDNEYWSVDLCEECLIEIFSNFKYPPSDSIMEVINND